MPLFLRSLLLTSAIAGLSACAANPIAPATAPIDYRNTRPSVRTATPARPPAAPPAQVRPQPAAADPLIVDLGAGTSLSAVEEAKAMRAEAGVRPGGNLRQPKLSKAQRTIQVQRGDTLYDISRRHSVNMRALIETNDLDPPYALNPGAAIYLPPPNVHVVEKGETLYSVSRRYNVDTRSLAVLNEMARPWTIWPGDELLLPPLARDQSRKVEVAMPVRQSPVAKSPVAKTPVAKPPSAPSLKPVSPKPAAAAVEAGAIALTPGVKLPAKPAAPPPSKPKPAPKPDKASELPQGSGDFIWPVSGKILKGFGTGEDGTRNDGINIAVPAGAKVGAAADGEVVYAGDELSGFGNLVLIRHAGGWVSAYAHAENLLVKEGDLVSQGDPIAEAGATGSAESPQVHFELRKGREPVDPAQHLPALKG